jgi:hypothetical protein
MSLKQFYATESEIPEGLKEHYVLKGDKYELSVEGFNSLPGVLTKNTELIEKQKTDKAEIDRLTNDLANTKVEVGKLSGDIAKASANALPAGYVAVAKKDAEALDEFKKQNLNPTDVLAKLTEFDGLNEKVKGMELEKSITEFAAAEGITNIDALSRLVRDDKVTPFVKEVEKDGKKEKRGFLKVANGDKTEDKAYAEYRDSNWSAFASALEPKKEGRKAAAGIDPPPSGNPSDEDEASKAAQVGQARVAHNAF